MANPEHVRRDVLKLVARHVEADVEARLAEVGDAQGCEAAAARAHQRGRLQVVQVDMWQALGLTRPGPPPLA